MTPLRKILTVLVGCGITVAVWWLGRGYLWQRLDAGTLRRQVWAALRSKPEIVNYEARLKTLCDEEEGFTVGVRAPSEDEERDPWAGFLPGSSTAELIRALVDPTSTATLSNGRYQICILSKCRKTSDILGDFDVVELVGWLRFVVHEGALRPLDDGLHARDLARLPQSAARQEALFSAFPAVERLARDPSVASTRLVDTRACEQRNAERLASVFERPIDLQPRRLIDLYELLPLDGSALEPREDFRRATFGRPPPGREMAQGLSKLIRGASHESAVRASGATFTTTSTVHGIYAPLALITNPQGQIRVCALETPIDPFGAASGSTQALVSFEGDPANLRKRVVTEIDSSNVSAARVNAILSGSDEALDDKVRLVLIGVVILVVLLVLKWAVGFTLQILDISARMRLARAMASRAATEVKKVESDLTQSEPTRKKIEVETRKAEVDTERARVEMQKLEMEMQTLADRAAKR